jgi:hypothetical protein
VIELQADYLAAKYLLFRGLPLDPIQTIFEKSPELRKPDPRYPPVELRIETSLSAREPGFRLELFQNDVLDCLAFLEFLAGPEPVQG